MHCAQTCACADGAAERAEEDCPIAEVPYGTLGIGAQCGAGAPRSREIVADAGLPGAPHDGRDIKFGDTYGRRFLSKVPEDEFGSVSFEDENDWGVPINNIIDAKKDRRGNLEQFHVENIGWLSKADTIDMIENDRIDNAIVVRPAGKEAYVRAKPDQKKSNNFSTMARS